MSYRKAEEILPIEIIELIQQYVDGESIYIPRKADNRQAWGSKTLLKEELALRNRDIFTDYVSGISVHVLAERYYLSEKSIQRIIRSLKRK